MSTLSDLAQIVLKVSPVLGTALFGPAGGVVAKLVANLFGATATDPDDIIDKMQADPDHDVKLKQLEVQQGELVTNLHATLYSKEVEDRESARQREIELAKLGKSDKMATFLTIAIVVALFSLIIIDILMFNSPSPSVAVCTTLGMIVGAILTELKEICRYHFGGGDDTQD